MNDITTNSQQGIAYFKCSDQRKFDGYFVCVQAIRSLFNNSDFRFSTPGFYINISDGLNSVRLTYFTDNKKATKKAIDDLLKKNNHITLFKHDEPSGGGCDEGYLRKRKFLNTYTHIGLDLLDYDVLYSRRLAAEYRLTYFPQRIPCKTFFETPFSKHSNFFNQLSAPSKKQLWEDLDYWDSSADWTHYLVNMLLPGDYHGIQSFSNFFRDQRQKFPPVTGDPRKAFLNFFQIDILDNFNPND